MLLIIILVKLGLVTAIQQMTVAGIFDEGDTQYAEVFRQAVEDVNNNRYGEVALVPSSHNFRPGKNKRSKPGNACVWTRID